MLGLVGKASFHQFCKSHWLPLDGLGIQFSQPSQGTLLKRSETFAWQDFVAPILWIEKCWMANHFSTLSMSLAALKCWMQESETEKRQLQKGTSAESVFSPSKHAVLYQINHPNWVRTRYCRVERYQEVRMPQIGQSTESAWRQHPSLSTEARPKNELCLWGLSMWQRPWQQMRWTAICPAQFRSRHIHGLPWSHHVPPWPTNQAAVAGRDDSSGSATGSTFEVPEMEA